MNLRLHNVNWPLCSDLIKDLLYFHSITLMQTKHLQKHVHESRATLNGNRCCQLRELYEGVKHCIDLLQLSVHCMNAELNSRAGL